jgi:hypothetical protein
MELFLVGAGISGATAAAETLVDGLAPLKSRFDRMPMLDRRLAGFPAQKHDFFVDAAGKIEQTGVEIFDLDADLIDFLDRFPGTLNMFLHFGASSSDLRNIHHHSAGGMDSARQGGQLRIDYLRSPLALNGAVQQRLDERQHRLSFF